MLLNKPSFLIQSRQDVTQFYGVQPPEELTGTAIEAIWLIACESWSDAETMLGILVRGGVVKATEWRIVELINDVYAESETEFRQADIAGIMLIKGDEHRFIPWAELNA